MKIGEPIHIAITRRVRKTHVAQFERAAFYQTPLYRQWLDRIEPMVEGEPIYRQLNGLEAWFRDPHGPMPPRWKMAVLTRIAVWPLSMLVPAILVPLLAPDFPKVLSAGLISAGIVVILTWVAMPLLVKVAHPWLHS